MLRSLFASSGLIRASFLCLAGFSLGSCTGGLNPVPVNQGGIKINPGDSVVLNVGGIRDLGIVNYRVNFRTVDPDFKNLTPFHDVTESVKAALQEGLNEISVVLPKNVTPPRPFLVVVEMLDLEDFLIDTVFSGTQSTRPDVNSTLAYSLIESFHSNLNPRPLKQYNGPQYSGLKELIRTKTDMMMSQSEHLSLSGVPFDKVMRFFKNGMAFNLAFIASARNYGVGFRAVADSIRPVPGVSTAATPESSLESCFKGFCYQYPTGFEVQLADGSWIPAPQLPFKQSSNNPAQILQGSAIPDPSLNLFAMEGEGSSMNPKIEVSATGYDQDDDYFEKAIRVRYTPRKLPSTLTSRPGFNEDKREEIAQDESITPSGSFEQSDRYVVQSIGYHEALNTALIDPTIFPECSTAGNCDTAFRDVFFMYTDGMAWVPYRWRYRYQDLARPPFFVKDQNQRINSTFFDAALQAKYQDIPNPAIPDWLVHSSHCETDSSATIPDSSIQNFYQQIQSKADGPWSCAFKVSDPDLNDDPNGALDMIHFGIEADDFTQIYLGAKLDPMNPERFSTSEGDSPLLFSDGNAFPLMGPLGAFKGAPTLFSPPLPPASPTSPLLLRAMTELRGSNNCGGHKRCAAGLVQVVIDNAVKVSAEQQANQTYSFSIIAHDSKVGGRSTSHSIQRGILFKPKAPLLINYSDLNAPSGAFGLNDLILNQEQQQVPARHDIHLSEIMYLARHASSTNPRDIGFDPDQLIGPSNREFFEVPDAFQNTVKMSPYITQPRTLCSSENPSDRYSRNGPAQENGINCRGAFGVQIQMQEAVSGSPGHSIKLGNSLRMLDATKYTHPREFDVSCNLEENNIGRNAAGEIIWDQRSESSGYFTESLPTGAPDSRVQSSLGGWTFEINVIDPDNIDLRSGEPSDPVYSTLLTNLAYSDSLYFCHPPKPNRNSLYFETYSSTNNASPNGLDPDSCVQWSTSPPIELQSIPVYYTGTDISGPKTRKLVYHRLRGRWIPRDQGLARKAGNPDPSGIIRNIFSTLKLHGNVFLNKSDTRDLSEPRIIENLGGTLKATGTFPIVLAAEKKEMLPCLRGSLGGIDQIITPENANFSRSFSVADTNHTNQAALTQNGAISGRYEAEWELLGNRTLQDFEFLKFIPYLNDCTVEETRNLSSASIVYDFPIVTGATSYTISIQDASNPNSPWIGQGSVPGPPFILSNVPSYRSYRFKNLPNLPPPFDGAESAPVTIQANPMPG
ncbi:MAG: hypothetical protein KGP28_09635, partial [Bdellovibrionales bacterium]|nr:hypothetical protein [Bdellovibrionales bacterium]